MTHVSCGKSAAVLRRRAPHGPLSGSSHRRHTAHRCPQRDNRQPCGTRWSEHDFLRRPPLRVRFVMKARGVRRIEPSARHRRRRLPPPCALPITPRTHVWLFSRSSSPTVPTPPDPTRRVATSSAMMPCSKSASLACAATLTAGRVARNRDACPGGSAGACRLGRRGVAENGSQAAGERAGAGRAPDAACSSSARRLRYLRIATAAPSLATEIS